jgi:hypothetical protein
MAAGPLPSKTQRAVPELYLEVITQPLRVMQFSSVLIIPSWASTSEPVTDAIGGITKYMSPGGEGLLQIRPRFVQSSRRLYRSRPHPDSGKIPDGVVAMSEVSAKLHNRAADYFPAARLGFKKNGALRHRNITRLVQAYAAG